MTHGRPGGSGGPIIDDASNKAIGIVKTSNYSPDRQEGTSTRRGSFSTAYQNEQDSFALVVNQKKSSGATLGGSKIGRWDVSDQEFDDVSFSGSSVILDTAAWVGNAEVFRADQGVYLNPKEKYNEWTGFGDNVVNHKVFQLQNQQYISQFQKTYSDISVTTKFPEYTSANGSGSIKFKDPWLIDYADPVFNDEMRNRGGNAEFYPHSAPFIPGFSTINGKLYNGLFLGENPNFLPNLPNYTVRAEAQSINFGGSLGTRQVYPMGWEGDDADFEDDDATETAVVFNASGAEARAKMKVSRISNSSSIFKANQRKVERSNNDWEHMVYESMGHVWYEVKEPSGSWEFVEGPGGIHMGDGTKSPSIAVKPTTSAWPWQYMTALVWQEGSNLRLQTFRYDSGSGTYIDAAPYEFISTGQSSSYNTQPNVVWTDNEELIVIYKTSSGIKYSVWTFHPTQIYLGEVASGTISGTTGASNITASTSTSGTNSFVGIAWEEDMGISGPPYYYGTEIKFASIKYISGSSSATVVVTPRRISNGSVVRNKEPSIVQKAVGTFLVGWISGVTTNSTWGDPYDTKATVASVVGCPFVICVSRSNLDHHVRSVSVSKLWDNSEGYVGWSQIYDQAGWIDYNKFVESSALFTFKSLNTKGWNVQLTSASDDDDISAQSYYPKTAPYYWLRSNSLGSYLKQVPLTATQGRSLVLSDSSGRAGLSIGIGEFFVDGQPVGFVPLDQFEEESENFEFGEGTQKHQSIEDLEHNLITNSFLITKDTELTFDEHVFLGDSLSILELLNKQGKVSVSINLVNNTTGMKEGVLREYSLTRENGLTRNKKSWSVDLSQFDEGEKRIELKVTTNLKGIKAEIETSYSDDFARGKVQPKKFYELEAQKTEIIADYQLAQNYPNPFNPSTQIEYQIPEAGLVTLEIFDVLGRKVQTLVNERKEVGRYSVTFNARSLATGVYVCQLTAGNFTSSKKMYLIK